MTTNFVFHKNVVSILRANSTMKPTHHIQHIKTNKTKPNQKRRAYHVYLRRSSTPSWNLLASPLNAPLYWGVAATAAAGAALGVVVAVVVVAGAVVEPPPTRAVSKSAGFFQTLFFVSRLKKYTYKDCVDEVYDNNYIYIHTLPSFVLHSLHNLALQIIIIMLWLK